MENGEGVSVHLCVSFLKLAIRFQRSLVLDDIHQWWATLFCIGANFKTSKSCVGCKPSDNNESHIFLTKFYIKHLSEKITNINAMRNINNFSQLNSFIVKDGRISTLN